MIADFVRKVFHSYLKECKQRRNDCENYEDDMSE